MFNNKKNKPLNRARQFFLGGIFFVFLFSVVITPLSNVSVANAVTTIGNNPFQNIPSQSSNLLDVVNPTTINIVVHINVPKDTPDGTYGPIPITLLRTATSDGQGISDTPETKQTIYHDAGGSSSVDLDATFTSKQPGQYRACIGNNVNVNQSSSTCVPSDGSFTHTADNFTSETITLSEKQSSTYFTKAPSTSDTSCNVDGVGWIVCPVLQFVGKVTDSAYSFIAKLLEYKSNFVSSDPNTSATYQVWVKVRDISNVLFVIAFLFIIFSQMTSIGITNYGIKKMLPRLIVAAILVNLSFFICQIAVDLSNMLGYTLKGFFDNVGSGLKIPVADAYSGNPDGLQIATIALAITGVGITALFAVSVPVILAVLLALFMTLLILLSRIAIITLLIVISPAAFVAYLLPNTEQWFKKWSKMFVDLLLVFPIVALLFGAGKLAAVVIETSAGSGFDDNMLKLLAAGVAVVPLFAVPSLLKGALSAAGTVGAKLSGWSSNANGKIGARVSDSSRLGTGYTAAMDYNKRQRQIKYAKGRSGLIGGLIAGKGYADYNKGKSEDIGNAEFEKDVSSAAVFQQTMPMPDKVAIATGVVKASEAQRAAAVRDVMKSGGYGDRKKVLESANVAGTSKRIKTSISNGFFAKGDQQFFGAKLSKDIENGTVDLNKSMISQIEAGEISAENLVANSAATADISALATSMDVATQKPILSQKAREELVKQTNIAFTSPGTQTKASGAVSEGLNKIKDNATKY